MIGQPAAVIAEYSLERAAIFYGARANYARMTGLVTLIHERGLPVTLVNTGQHWDPDFIGDGFGRHVDAVNLDTRTSDSDAICEAAKAHLKKSNSDGVFVYGDTASALGPARAAYELGLPLIHLEGGFRTYDSDGRRIASPLPEEAIRNKIDRIADVIVPLVSSAAHALHVERAKGLITGVITEPTGHPLADVILTDRARFDEVEPDNSLGMLTIHRKANLEGGLDSGLAKVLDQVARIPEIAWLFPASPATHRLIESVGLRLPPNVHKVSPLDHDTVLTMMRHAGVIVSDSAGLQVEAGLVGRRMVIPRAETEYPDLLSDSMVMTEPRYVAQAVRGVQAVPLPSAERKDEIRTVFGDGKAASNLFQHIAQLTVSTELARVA